MKRLLASLLAAFAATAAMADALDTSLFLMKSEMTIPGYAGSTTLANFPVLVRLAANSPTGFDYNDCAADGSDIRFADANGDLIPHEIDTWNTSGAPETRSRRRRRSSPTRRRTASTPDTSTACPDPAGAAAPGANCGCAEREFRVE